MTAREALRLWREAQDAIDAGASRDSFRAQQAKAQASLDKIGLGHLTGQRGKNHPADCACRICFPQGTGEKFQIRLEPGLAQALKKIPRERLIAGLEQLITKEGDSTLDSLAPNCHIIDVPRTNG